ncbi:hypothetical protein RFI_19110, partial [Reticulomyxa filosa]
NNNNNNNNKILKRRRKKQQQKDQTDIESVVVFDNTTIAIAKYPVIDQFVPQYRHQLQQWNKLSGEKTGRYGYSKRYRLYFKMVRALEHCLKWVTQELDKYASGISDAVKPLRVAQQYLNFQLARVTLVRLQDWQRDQIVSQKKKKKRGGGKYSFIHITYMCYIHTNDKKDEERNSTDNSKDEKKIETHANSNGKKTKAKITSKQKNTLFHDLALMCEEQIKQIDILYESGSATKHAEFEKELDSLRQSYEIQRRYYIGRIYYANGDFHNSNLVFETLQTDCQQYLQEHSSQNATDNPFKPNGMSGLECHPLSKFLNIFSGLNLYLKNVEKAKTSLESWEIEDFGLTLYPLVPKPVIFDLAWNHIEYDVDENDAASHDNKKHRHHRHDTEEEHPAETKEQEEQQSRKKWFGIF